MKLFKEVTVFFIFVSALTQTSLAEDATLQQTYDLPMGQIVTYDKPDWKTIFTELPNSAVQSLKQAFTKDTLLPWVGILGSTSLLYQYDEDILAEVQRQGRDLGIGNEDNTKTMIEVGGINLIRLPTDTGSFLYFIGDGWTQAIVTSSFFIYGVSQDDYRAWSTSYQLVHGLALSTFYNQILKRAAGRESPTNSTRPRGRWRPFPSFNAYNNHTPDYDAMPSGHIMTGSMVLTIINQNYPEYSHVTIPVGVTLLSLLGWQMVNNGVHWASDYPLGIAMGVFYGRYVAKNWKYKKMNDNKESSQSEWHILPVVQNHYQGLTWSYDF